MTALYIILGIIAVIILIFCIKISVEMIYDETFTVAVKVLFIKIKIYPELMEKSKKKEETAEKKPDEQEAAAVKDTKKQQTQTTIKKENPIKKFYRNQGFNGVVIFIKDILKALNSFLGAVFIRGMVIEKLFLQMFVGGGDAASAAISYGKTCSAVYPALGYICEKMRVKKYNADISVDYLAPGSTAMFNVVLSLRPIRLTNAAVVLLVKALFAYIRAKKREKVLKTESINNTEIKTERNGK